MSETDCDTFDGETLEELFEPTVEVPAAVLLAAACCGCCGGAMARRRYQACC
jgi:hypothetical protein